MLQNFVAAERPEQETTLCSLAFSLVMANNQKAYCPHDMESKLQAGYQDGFAAFEGCRIRNKVLFGVLAEIS
ncbi:hypothetical protein EJ08DRAFT_585236 [Tothia fuscella]|uniref:Uncharacterized protein n=1 Tax=Tothia fuscella TaxID=1048955 RepID=A0A9P4NVI4_9PEZI|nr:hypothetical protein EJ08DRAFT_585236 [Tothia fuscella]